MPKITVLHRGYGCDTGCCGHVIEVDGKEEGGFALEHPGDDDFRAWAEDLIRERLGAEHVADLDWENSQVSYD